MSDERAIEETAQIFPKAKEMGIGEERYNEIMKKNIGELRKNEVEFLVFWNCYMKEIKTLQEAEKI